MGTLPLMPALGNTLPQRTLGKTGVRVPLLGFGTASCGIRRGIENGVELYNKALDLGVTYFDTAPSHTGYGRAQKQLGYVCRDRRREMFLVTKCHESDGDAALRALDSHLKELQTDRADLVHLHSLGDYDMGAVMGKGGALAALMRAKAEGKTRFVGVSGHSRVGNFVKLLNSEWADRIDVMMVSVNFADRHTYDFEGRVLPLAARKRIGLVAMKVFGGADWASKAMSNAAMPGEFHDRGLRYALSLPNMACAVVGMATEEELRENLARVKAFRPLTDGERRALTDPGQRLARRWGAHYGPV